ncbi:hypothetical protein GW17_00059099 [Ensete ventricosum]|nr:hypothetical protein GW17_00059099 [Ensete ventricosum]
MNLVPPMMRIFLELDALTCRAPLGCHVLLLFCTTLKSDNSLGYEGVPQMEGRWVLTWSEMLRAAPLNSERDEGRSGEDEEAQGEACLGCIATNLAMSPS